ncbi:universal stress protein [Streptomyces sp. NPDC086519]|uniref:universal stress protein n=1 Tax=Streptomyces sp. NPDC086519 TaxID=3154863 RepID=UPI003413CF39
MVEETGNSIVVGVDGSEASLAALRWAAEHARSTHANVLAVRAWEPAGTRFAPYAPTPVRPTPAEQRAEAARVLAATVREVLGPRNGRSARAVLVEGPPARVLPAQAAGALLLVLGRRTHVQRELPELGPVGRACVRGATVPVVMVPAAPHPAASPGAARDAGRHGPGARHAHGGPCPPAEPTRASPASRASREGTPAPVSAVVR